MTNHIISTHVVRSFLELAAGDTVEVTSGGHLDSTGLDGVIVDGEGTQIIVRAGGLITAPSWGVSEGRYSFHIDNAGTIRGGEFGGGLWIGGGTVINRAGGMITTTGVNDEIIDVRGVYAVNIENAGLIGLGDGRSIRIADFQPAQDDTVTNLGTGVIAGSVEMGLGDDTVTNAGQIDGAVILSDGDDRVENAGTLNGGLLLGNGQDSAHLTATSRLQGGLDAGSGSDTITIEAGAQIAGDVLGGGGNDEFFFTLGADVDVLDGGDGFDSITIYSPTASPGALPVLRGFEQVKIITPNTPPTVTGPVTATASEGAAPVTLDALANASDPNADQTLQVVGVPSLPPFLTYNAGTHSFTLNPAAPIFNALAQGQSQVVGATYGVTDGESPPVTGEVRFTVQGVNDAPTVAGPVTGTATENGPALTLHLLTGASDVDNGTTLTVVWPHAPPAGTVRGPGDTLSILTVGHDRLAAGETVTQSFAYQVSDGIAAVDQVATWTITGVNDAPTVAAPLTAAATEGGAASVVNALQGAADVDNGAVLSVVLPATLPDGVTYDADARTFTLDPAHAAYDRLAQGAQETVSVTYGVTDGTATTPQTITWTVTGTNDAPRVDEEEIDIASTVGGAPVVVDLWQGVTDPDGPIVLGDFGHAVPGMSVVTDNRFVTFDANLGYAYLGAGETSERRALFFLTDEFGGAVDRWVHWTVTGVNDAPTVSGPVTGAAIEGGAAVTLDALQGAEDRDFSAVLTVVDVPASLPAGVSYDAATKTFRLDPTNAAYNGLAAGATQVVAVSYGVSDGTATVAQTAKWTVTGANDGPTAVADTGSVTNNQTVVLNVLGNDTDPDVGDGKTIVSVSGTALGGGVSIVDGKIVYAANADSFDFLILPGLKVTDSFTYTMQDASGATSTATVKVTVNGTFPSLPQFGGSGHDSLTGGAGIDVIDGGSGNDTLAGLEGIDSLSGGSGNDVLEGGSGGDLLDGDAGNDKLNGGAGTDLLNGDSGNDTLNGGAGNDLLSGDSGDDRFVFTGAFGRDVVSDFDRRDDVVQFDRATFANYQAMLAHARQVGGDVVITVDADNTVTLENVRLSQLNSGDFLFV